MKPGSMEMVLQSRICLSAVIESGSRRLPFRELLRKAQELSATLRAGKIESLALLADNGPAWIAADFACQLGGIPILPLPLFFSPSQCSNAMHDAGIQAVLTDRDIGETMLGELTEIGPCGSGDETLRLYVRRKIEFARLPPMTGKITYTSGSTGSPKGVCLSTEQLWRVARSLSDLVGNEPLRHLCVLPLTTLLENVAGVYAPILSGGNVIVPSIDDVGLTGSSSIDVSKMTGMISETRPNTLILVPALLAALVAATRQGWQPPDSLQFIAVGGAKVSRRLLMRARDAGLPAYEGYGLSEAGSVVACNRPGASLSGSVGRVLPHLKVSIDRGEIVVRGNQLLGYANDPASWGRDEIRTGDLGILDDHGFLQIRGRIKDLLISSFGRNISPEWPESELLGGPLLQQAVVFGDARPYCVALIYPGDPSTPDERIDDWVLKVNRGLPDYARIRAWARLRAPLSAANGLLTETGKPRRKAIVRRYANKIECLYRTDREFAVS